MADKIKKVSTAANKHSSLLSTSPSFLLQCDLQIKKIPRSVLGLSLSYSYFHDPQINQTLNQLPRAPN